MFFCPFYFLEDFIARFFWCFLFVWFGCDLFFFFNVRGRYNEMIAA